MIALLLAACDGDPDRPDPRPDPEEPAPEALAPPDARVLVGEAWLVSAGESVGATFSWTLDDGRVLSGVDVELSFEVPGHHVVVLEARNDDGRTDTDDFVVTAHWPAAPVAPRTARAIAAAPDRIYVPLRDFDLLAVVDRATGGVTHEPTCRRPRTVALGDAGPWVACEGDEIALHRADGRLRVSLPLPRGARPYGVVADGATALVTLSGTGEVARVDESGVVDRVLVGPDPRGIALAGDPAHVFVTRWRSDDAGGAVYELDADLAPVATRPLAYDPGPDSDTNTRGLPTLLSPVAARPDGRVLAVGGLKSNVQRGEFLEGLPFTHDTTTRADLRQLALVPDEGPVGAEVAPVVFDDRDQVVGIAWSPDGDWLYALHLGMEVVDVLDAYTLRRSGAATPTGHGPDALVVDGGELFVSAPLSRLLTVFDLSRPELPAPKATIDLLPPGGEVRPADELQGEIVFTSTADRRMSEAGYAACATCHPEGRADGRTWDFTQRGEGLRNTASLLGGAGVAPLHWTANFDEVQDFENDIRNAMAGTGFLSDADFATHADPLDDPPKAGLSPELDALAAYLASLNTAPTSPWRDPDGGPSDAALRGLLVFRDPAVGCATCHPAPTYTDSQFLAPATPLLHDVGTAWAGSGQRRGGALDGFDTPTLRGLWDTAPYLHDGSAPDLRAVLVDRNPDDRHGATSGLTAEQLDDLVAFLLSVE